MGIVSLGLSAVILAPPFVLVGWGTVAAAPARAVARLAAFRFSGSAPSIFGPWSPADFPGT